MLLNSMERRAVSLQQMSFLCNWRHSVFLLLKHFSEISRSYAQIAHVHIPCQFSTVILDTPAQT